MPDSKKVLVTGGNGLLGSNIVRELVNKGYSPLLLLRRGCNCQALRGLKYDIVEGELQNYADLEKAVKECNYIIHCAAKTGQKGELIDYLAVNTEPVKILAFLCKKYSVKRFIYISTANCFTNGSIQHPGTESSGFMPWLKKSGYAYSKFLAQEFLLKEFRTNNFPVVVLAPTFLIGAGDAKISSGQLLLHGIKNRIIFYPPGGKSFVDAEYAARATVNALEYGRNGECYLISGENLSYKAFFTIVKQNYNPKVILIKLPHWLIKPVALGCDLVQWLFNTEIILNRTNWRLLSLNNYFSNQKAKKELKMKDSNTEQALHKTYKWFVENKYISNGNK